MADSTDIQALISSLDEWFREPDSAEEFTIADVLVWAADRPTAEWSIIRAHIDALAARAAIAKAELLTEEDAKTKWCPHAMAMTWEAFRDGEKPATANRGPGAFEQCRCIASQCMAWRWDGWVNKTEDGKLEDIGGLLVVGRHETQCKFGGLFVGYCGLAGKPARAE